MSDYVILQNIGKSFKNESIISNIDLSIKSGTITGIIGRNGSGKTVMLKILCGLMRPSVGTVIINGEVMGDYRRHPDNIGAVIENPGFIPYRSGYKNLKYLADIQKKIGKEEIRAAIKKVGLDPDSKKHVSKYSLGMKQRLGIAQALMEHPDLIILDEPMNGLDKQGVEEIRNLLIDLKKQGKTIIITSHNSEDIDILCDDVYEMDRGDIKKMVSCR